MVPNDANAALPIAKLPCRASSSSGSPRRYLLLSTCVVMVVGWVYIVVHLVIGGSTL